MYYGEHNMYVIKHTRKHLITNGIAAKLKKCPRIIYTDEQKLNIMKINKAHLLARRYNHNSRLKLQNNTYIQLSLTTLSDLVV